MNRIHTVFAFALLAGVFLTLPAHSSAKTKARLDAGEIIINSKKVPGSEQPMATVMAVVNAPPKRVWGIIANCSDYAKTMVRVVKAQELWVKGKVHRCKVTVDLPFPLSDLTAITDAVHTVVPGKKWERKWNLVEGDYKRNTGSWTLAPFDKASSRTLVIYKMHVEPNVPIPDGIRRAAQRKSLPNLIENLRKPGGG